VGQPQALSIAAVAQQIGGGLLPDNDQWTNRFRVKSQTSSAYYVIAQRRADKVWGCSCRGWIHYRRCKHLNDVLSRLAALADRVVDQSSSYEPTARAVLIHARAAFVDLESAGPVAVSRPKVHVAKLD
jgi:hypothetical protein